MVRRSRWRPLTSRRYWRPSDLDWSEIDPSILGTLFERGLDPGKRAQLGAHYTDLDLTGGSVSDERTGG